jgi:hypothetical protein
MAYSPQYSAEKCGRTAIRTSRPRHQDLQLRLVILSAAKDLLLALLTWTVILSEVAAPRSEVAAQSKDPYTGSSSPLCTELLFSATVRRECLT